MCFGWGPHLWWSLFMCVGFLSFCDGGALSSSSPPAGGGVGCCWASFGVAAVPLVLGHLRFSAACPAVATLHGFCTWLTQVGWPTPAVDVFVGLVGSWYPTWFSTLCQRSFPFHCFPLAGSAPSPFCCLPFAGAAPFQAPVCGFTPEVVPCG